MKVLGIIPSRYQSSRFPGKPLVDLKGKSMIQRVYEGAQKSSLIDKVIVATDDQRIYDEVTAFGGSVEMTSPNHSTGTDRCGEIASKFPEYDIIINIQGDEPLVDYRQLNQLIQLFEDESVQIGTLGISLMEEEDLKNPNRIKIVLNHQNQALYFSRSNVPNTEKYSENPFEKQAFLRHIGLYGFRRETLNRITQLAPCDLESFESLEQLRWLYYGYPIQVGITDIETPNVDTPEDVAKVLALIE